MGPPEIFNAVIAGIAGTPWVAPGHGPGHRSRDCHGHKSIAWTPAC